MHSFGQFRRAKEKTIRVRDRVEFGLTKRSGSERCRTVERPPSGERRWNRVRSNLGSSEMASQLLRGGRERERIEGDKEQRGRERERKGREQGRGMVVRVVFVEEQREGTWTKIGPVMEMREGPADNGFRGRAP